VERLEANRLVDRVLTLTTLERIEATADGFAVAPLVRPDDGRGPEARRRRALEDRFAPGLVLSRDGDTVALIVRPVGLQGSAQRVEVLEATRAALAAEGLEPWVAGMAGEVALAVAQLRSMVRDSATFIPILVVTGLALVGWLFRRAVAVVLSALAIGAVVLCTVAVIVLWGRPYTLVSAMIPALLTALTVAPRRGPGAPCPGGDRAARPLHRPHHGGRSGLAGPQPRRPHRHLRRRRRHRGATASSARTIRSRGPRAWPSPSSRVWPRWRSTSRGRGATRSRRRSGSRPCGRCRAGSRRAGLGRLFADQEDLLVTGQLRSLAGALAACVRRLSACCPISRPCCSSSR